MGRYPSWILGALLGVSLVGCKDDSSACAGGNQRKCDIFTYPVRLRQDQPRLHFTSWQVTQGTCELPRCGRFDCTDLVFDDLFFQVEVTGSSLDAAASGTRCRYQISSAEGETLDVLLSLDGSSPFSFCCDTGLRRFISYGWSAFANGLELDYTGPSGFRLPSSLDGGTTGLDAVFP